MISATIYITAVCAVIFTVMFLCLAILGTGAACRWWLRTWRDGRGVIEQTVEEARLRAAREARYRAFDEHAASALAIVRADDWDEALERLTAQEGTEQ
jgi:hypothetical protein